MTTFEQVKQVPVLLSMLTVVLGALDTSSKIELPTDVYQLYRMAIECVVSKSQVKTLQPEITSIEGDAAVSAPVPMLQDDACMKNVLDDDTASCLDVTIVSPRVGKSTPRPGTAMECLRRIAYQNHLARRRVFTSGHVDETLGDDAVLRDIWRQLSELESPPLIKILSVASKSGEGGEYQFAHLSFQEFLFLEV